MYETLAPYVLGAVLGFITCFPARRLDPAVERTFFTAIMTFVAVGFIGFPLERGHWPGVLHEGVAMALFLVGIGLSRWWDPAMLALTFFVHGAWDLAWLVGTIDSIKPNWLTEFCVPYDWVLAAYLLSRRQIWRSPGGGARGNLRSPSSPEWNS